jgi:hypothetical protein
MQALTKNAGLAFSIVFVLLFAALLSPGCSKKPDQNGQVEGTEQAPTTFAGQVERDKERFLTEPQPVAQETPPVNEPAPAVVQPKPTATKTLYFKGLDDEIDQIEAERLLNVAVPGLSIGRLPVTSYKLMVDTCRQIIQRWPDSLYAYNSKRMMAQLPEHDKQTYGITSQEVDITMYEKPRTGTQPYTVKE